MDDAPIQGGLTHEAINLTGQSPQFSVIGLREMVVVDVTYADEPGNRSGRYPEYTVRDLMTGELLPGARRLALLGDPNNGDDNVLHPQRAPLPGTKPMKFTRSTPAKLTDGTRVLVGFVEASHNRPVIIGVFPHPAAAYGAKAADGERRYTTHQGTSVEMRADGTYAVTRGDTSIVVDADANVSVMHKTGATITISEDGSINVVPATGKLLRLAEAAAGPLDGVVHGSGIDTFTGVPYATLGNASTVVVAKK